MNAVCWYFVTKLQQNTIFRTIWHLNTFSLLKKQVHLRYECIRVKPTASNFTAIIVIHDSTERETKLKSEFTVFYFVITLTDQLRDRDVVSHCFAFFFFFTNYN